VSLEYTIKYENPFLRVETQGIFDFVKVFEMWEAIFATCREHNCFKILGISNLEKPVPSMDAYDHLSLLQTTGVTQNHRIAWVAGKPELLERLRLTETVLRTRGSINIRAFDSLKAATRWLEKDNSD